MKYSVLKQLDNERKSKMNDHQAVTNNDEQEIISSRHYLGTNAKKTRRFRSAFTTEQIKYLEKQFKKCPYIESGSRKAVSGMLNIPERAVKIWFQNRRMKEKKEAFSKETAAEDQNELNVARAVEQSHVKVFDQQSDTTSHHTLYQPKTTICPEFTNATSNSSSGNRTLCFSNELSKSLHEKQRITVKNFDNTELFNPNITRTVNKVAPRQIKDNDVNVKMPQNKNIGTTKKEIPASHNLKNVRLKTKIENGLTSTATNSPTVLQPYYYQVNPGHDQSYVETFPQSPPFASGSIMWKPINMVSVLPGLGSPQLITQNNRYFQNGSKEECKCNCNSYNMYQDMPHLMPHDGRQHLSPQYILTMPFSNHFHRT